MVPQSVTDVLNAAFEAKAKAEASKVEVDNATAAKAAAQAVEDAKQTAYDTDVADLASKKENAIAVLNSFLTPGATASLRAALKAK